MPTTSNFGWTTPADTDLVKDGAAAIRTLGNGIDTSLVDLKGGTTGQVLSKASNTDLDYTWVTTDDANAIQNAIVDAKGDLIAASAADTPARLAVGNNGETLVADSAATTGLRWQGNFAAGKNKIINGDFRIAQRGTSITLGASGYSLDRYAYAVATAVPTGTISQQTFTPGAAPVAGYEGSNFLQINVTANNGCTILELGQKIEDVRTFAGQTATFSFYAKADAASTLSALILVQNFGSGGSGDVTTTLTLSSTALTTSWTRYTATVSVPSISGKTIGTSSFLEIKIRQPLSAGVVRNGTYDYWGWQFEAGSVATAFQTATGTIQGELAACQRYYYRHTASGVYTFFCNGNAYNTTIATTIFPLPVTMRTAPSALETSGTASHYRVVNGATSTACSAVPSFDQGGVNSIGINFTVASGLTAGQAINAGANNTTSAYLGVSAEL